MRLQRGGAFYIDLNPACREREPAYSHLFLFPPSQYFIPSFKIPHFPLSPVCISNTSSPPPAKDQLANLNKFQTKAQPHHHPRHQPPPRNSPKRNKKIFVETQDPRVGLRCRKTKVETRKRREDGTQRSATLRAVSSRLGAGLFEFATLPWEGFKASGWGACEVKERGGDVWGFWRWRRGFEDRESGGTGF